MPVNLLHQVFLNERCLDTASPDLLEGVGAGVANCTGVGVARVAGEGDASGAARGTGVATGVGVGTGVAAGVSLIGMSDCC